MEAKSCLARYLFVTFCATLFYCASAGAPQGHKCDNSADLRGPNALCISGDVQYKCDPGHCGDGYGGVLGTLKFPKCRDAGTTTGPTFAVNAQYYYTVANRQLGVRDTKRSEYVCADNNERIYCAEASCKVR